MENPSPKSLSYERLERILKNYKKVGHHIRRIKGKSPPKEWQLWNKHYGKKRNNLMPFEVFKVECLKFFEIYTDTYSLAYRKYVDLGLIIKKEEKKKKSKSLFKTAS